MCTGDKQVFDRIVGVVNGFKRYFLDPGEPVSENPSPGNVAGGIPLRVILNCRPCAPGCTRRTRACRRRREARALARLTHFGGIMTTPASQRAV